MGAAKRDHSPGEAMNLPVLFEKAPVQPADGVILAVRVIVTSLGPTKFVSAQQHRDATRNKECEEKILDQAISQGFDIGGIAWAFNSAIVAVIGIGAVPPVLAVFLIVLLSIGNQIIQCESVMTGDKIDRKSTRLNSSHGYISYSVFCLKRETTHTA